MTWLIAITRFDDYNRKYHEILKMTPKQALIRGGRSRKEYKYLKWSLYPSDIRPFI